MNQLYFNLRHNFWSNLFVTNLRYAIGIGFIPSGLVKVTNHPFTRIENTGIFFDYLDALYTTGYYYNMIGVMQMLAGILLITQRYAPLGAFIFLPIIFNIAILTLSTIGTLTPVIAVLMLLGTIFLLLWDYYKWINILSPRNNLILHNIIPVYPVSTPAQEVIGILLLMVPAAFYFLSSPKLMFLSAVTVLLAGNIHSIWRYRQEKNKFSRNSLI